MIRKVEPIQAAGFFFLVGVSIFLVWFVFMSGQFDPFHLGIKSEVQGKIQISSTDRKTREDIVITSCQIPSSVYTDTKPGIPAIFSGVDSQLEMRVLDTGSRHEFQNVRFAYSAGQNAAEMLTSCNASSFNLSSAYAGGRGRSEPGVFSGDLDVTCEGQVTKKSYHIALQFENCSF